MNLAHLHLVLNHFPIIGTIVGLGLFLGSLVGKNADLRRAGLIVLAVIALVAIPTFFSGVGAQGAIKNDPGVSEALIERHEGAAMLAFFFMEITGALALVELWKHYRISTSGTLDLDLVRRPAFLDYHDGAHGQSGDDGWRGSTSGDPVRPGNHNDGGIVAFEDRLCS